MIPPAAVKLVKMFEGCVLEPYQDSVGVWTVGVGHVLPDDAPLSDITQEEADELLALDLAIADQDVSRCVKVPLTENQRAALISFTFNLGGTALAKSTLLRKLNEGDYLGAAQEMPKWSNAGGVMLKGLLRRRLAEQALFAKP